ncbi:MAG: hypothetical protein FWF84_05100, partial [Kiritimatiellaeota bacterium]|nr:hypothetical protein [Kiritimatiellota bacterium]
MKKKSLLCCLVALMAFTALSVIPEPPPRAGSPFELAMALEGDLARFSAVMLPDTNLALRHDYGALPFPEAAPAGFPSDFVSGLAPAMEYGFEVFPVTLKVDEPTGDTVFNDVHSNAFWSVAANSSYYPEWILDLHGGSSPWLEEALRPSRVELLATFVAEQDITPYVEAKVAAKMGQHPQGHPAPWPLDKPALDIAAFEASSNAFYFASAWNAVAYFPLSRLDLLYKPSLDAPGWSYVKSIPVSNGGSRAALFDIPHIEIPRPPFVHDALCAPVEIVIDSPLDDGVTYTNFFCECVAPPLESPSGFFRLSIPD